MTEATGGFVPIIEVEIEVNVEPDRPKLVSALSRLGAGTPEFGFTIDDKPGRAKLIGTSDRQLAEVVDVLRNADQIAISVGVPQIVYRETITQSVDLDYTHKRQFGGSGQYARVKLVVAPNQRGAGNAFESRAPADAIPQEFVPGIERGVNTVLDSGVLAGFPVVDVVVALVDAGYHDVDSSALTFEIATRAAVREALQRSSTLLEPVMRVEVVTPPDFTPRIIEDLRTRRGQVEGRDRRDDAVVITAMVPAATMLGYDNALRSMTSGGATFTQRFDHYAPVPTPPDDVFPSAMVMRA